MFLSSGFGPGGGGGGGGRGDPYIIRSSGLGFRVYGPLKLPSNIRNPKKHPGLSLNPIP